MRALYIGLAILVAIGVLSVFGFVTDPFGWRKHKLETVTGQRDLAIQDATLAKETGKTVERYFNTERIIEAAASPIIETITEAPGADTPLPDDLRASWLAGINSLRQPSNPAPDDHRSPGTGSGVP